jgi:LPS-assembly protein
LALPLAGLLAFFSGAPAFAQFLPVDFLADLPEPGSAAQVEADLLGYDQGADVISAEGRVEMHYAGYTVQCDDLRYEQQSGALVCVGHVEIRDKSGTVYRADRFEVTKGMKSAVLRALTLTTSSGAIISAKDVRFSKELGTILEEATYSPCGLCIDAKGHRIGWQVLAVRMVQDEKTKTVSFDQPRLELLGIPMAWLPFLQVPDPSDPRQTGLQLPTIDHAEEIGVRVTAPFFIGLGRDTDVLLSPALMSRQGLLMGAKWRQRFDTGSFTLRGWGVKQADPGAFAGKLGDRDLRWAWRSTGEFRLGNDWSAGWGYTGFSDHAFLGDYALDANDATINNIHATELSRDSMADIRLEDYQRLGEVSDSAQQAEADVLPNARGSTEIDLGENGRFRLSGVLQNVKRGALESALIGGVPYVLGYEGDKLHGTAEATWQKQMILPGGVVATPMAGLRLDGTQYDQGKGTDAGLGAGEPDSATLFAATPLAAIDIRWPLMMKGPDLSSILFEPIGQLVYRGTDVSAPGVTNDNAHSFVLDDTNLFSTNRFSGTDRQDTGLRANVGFRAYTTLGAAGWLEATAGQSFQLAGTDSVATADPMQIDKRSDVIDGASPIILAVRGSPGFGLTLAGKTAMRTGDDAGIGRTTLGASYDADGYSLGANYVYLPKSLLSGVIEDSTVLTVNAASPLPLDYWRLSGSVSWDLVKGDWLLTTADLSYDDGFVVFSGFASATGPANSNPDKIVLGAKIKLKGPDGDARF